LDSFTKSQLCQKRPANPVVISNMKRRLIKAMAIIIPPKIRSARMRMGANVALEGEYLKNGEFVWQK